MRHGPTWCFRATDARYAAYWAGRFYVVVSHWREYIHLLRIRVMRCGQNPWIIGIGYFRNTGQEETLGLSAVSTQLAVWYDGKCKPYWNVDLIHGGWREEHTHERWLIVQRKVQRRALRAERMIFEVPTLEHPIGSSVTLAEYEQLQRKLKWAGYHGEENAYAYGRYPVLRRPNIKSLRMPAEEFVAGLPPMETNDERP